MNSLLTIPRSDYFQDLSFLQSIIDSIEEGVVVQDRNGKIIAFNEKAVDILGLSAGEIFGKTSYDPEWHAIHLDGSPAPGNTHPVITTLKTGVPQNNVILGVRIKDEPVKWLSVNTRLIGINDSDDVFVFAAFTDVSALINSNRTLQLEQEKLRSSEEKFSRCFLYSAIGMAIVSPDGGMRDVNGALCKMLGYTREELLERSFQDITHPDDLEKDLSLVRKMLRREMETYQLEKRYLHKDGQTIWALLNVALVWNTDDEPQFFVSQVQEVTELKKLNKGLEDQNLELLKTQGALKRKITQLKDFAGIITHDVRGPAHNMKKMLEMYIDAQSEETKKTSLHLLKKISSDLVNNLNELVHVLQVHLEKDIPYSHCRFDQVMDSVSLQLQDTVTREKATIIKDFQVPGIYYPRIYLQSILYNLVSNSLKYHRPGVPPEIRISSFAKGDEIYLSVADNGLGIDLEVFGSMLFKFQKSFHKGFDSKGIGLYMIRNQVEELGGAISAESEVNKGSTFTVRF
jgi:PAS domain S-box-containing protein